MKWFAIKLLKGLAWLMVHSPRFIRHGMGAAIGILWFDIFRIRRRLAIANVAKAFPDWDRARCTHVARASCIHLGLNLVEFCLFPFLSTQNIDRYVEFDGWENVQQALQQGKGILFLGLHLGNGDLAIGATALKGVPLYLISKEFKSSWLNDMWFGVRGRLGTKFIPVEKSSFEILRALRNNQGVIFVLDQYMGPPSGVLTTFFGQPTGTAAGLALFADRTRAPVIPAYGYRNASGGLTVAFEKPLEFQEFPTQTENIARMTQLYTDKIEEIVRKHPEQWMWIHRRWKKFG